MAIFDKQYHPPGTAPGTLARPHPRGLHPLRITAMEYTGEELVEHEFTTAAQCAPCLERDSVTWIHVQGDIEPAMLEELGTLFGLHQLSLEDVLNTGQRPKVDSFEGTLFVVLSLPVRGEAGASVEQVSLFVGSRYLLSFNDGPSDPFGPVRGRLRRQVGRIHLGRADYLLYSLLDVVIDQGFPVLEDIGEEIEALEEELLARPTRETLNRIHQLKRELLLLRRMLWPQREVLNALLRAEDGLIGGETKLFLRDCYDHTVQIMDLLESYRDMTAGMLDVYLSSVSNRLNENMRILTLIGTIFIPLTFIAGVYGMNFGNNTKSPWAMPELGWYYGYPLAWLLMVVVAIGMLLLFKRKEWF
jgi:magnesium transporter